MLPDVANLFGMPEEAELLTQALTHPSHANERRSTKHNQRLEFLGDAVLELCSSEHLFDAFPTADEGELTRRRAQLVNADALAAFARRSGVADALRLGKGAEANGLRDSTNVLADAVEALIAAAYLHGGLDGARRACQSIVEDGLRQASWGDARDSKTALQEQVQAMGYAAPSYSVLETGGPAHERWFRVGVSVGSVMLGQGRGRSKRLAERDAASQALDGGFDALTLAGAADAP